MIRCLPSAAAASCRPADALFWATFVEIAHVETSRKQTWLLTSGATWSDDAGATRRAPEINDQKRQTTAFPKSFAAQNQAGNTTNAMAIPAKTQPWGRGAQVPSRRSSDQCRAPTWRKQCRKLWPVPATSVSSWAMGPRARHETGFMEDPPALPPTGESLSRRAGVSSKLRPLGSHVLANFQLGKLRIDPQTRLTFSNSMATTKLSGCAPPSPLKCCFYIVAIPVPRAIWPPVCSGIARGQQWDGNIMTMGQQ